MLTRRDFIEAAVQVRDCTVIHRGPADIILVGDRERDMLAHFLADWFGENNPSFDRDLFLAECGMAVHNPEACSGCGCQPGDGLTLGCTHPGGCEENRKREEEHHSCGPGCIKHSGV